MGNKLGYQAPKNFRVNHFNYVDIKGDLHYCESHNFMYNKEDEEKALYDGKPNYFTDKRYYPGNHNYFKSSYLHFSRSRWGSKFGISLKSAFRLIEQCNNIPVGTVVKISPDWTYGNKMSPDYHYIVRKENKFDPQYEITLPSFSRNFKRDGKSHNLVKMLRENGFLVQVWDENPSFIGSMLKTAGAIINPEDLDLGGEHAIAYGFGKKIGFSSHSDSFMGYSNGCDNILFDKYGEFDKWSRCYEIPKTNKAIDIIKRLKG